MTVRYIGTADTGSVLADGDVVGAASGGTLAGGQLLQVVFDDATYTGQEGKQRLLNNLIRIVARIEQAKTWPIDSTS